MKKSSAEPGWRLVERIAAQLEKALTPYATVEHNVRLPVLGTKRKRQCDIVIKYGDAPRQTIAIAEVQKRKSKPDITTFHGWIEKMRQVGAQHLICVSARGYPKSIIEEVMTRHGPTVRLLTLKELQQPKLIRLVFPFNFALYKKPKFIIEDLGPIVFDSLVEYTLPEGDINLRADAEVFGWDDDPKRISLNDIIIPLMRECAQRTAEEGIYDPDFFTVELQIGQGEGKLWYYSGEQRIRVKVLPARVTLHTEYTEIPATYYSYEQHSVNGSLAWVVTAKGDFEGNEVSFQIVFKPNKDGLLELYLLQQQGVQSISFPRFADEVTLKAAVDYHRSKIRNGPTDVELNNAKAEATSIRSKKKSGKK